MEVHEQQTGWREEGGNRWKKKIFHADKAAVMSEIEKTGANQNRVVNNKSLTNKRKW